MPQSAKLGNLLSWSIGRRTPEKVKPEMKWYAWLALILLSTNFSSAAERMNVMSGYYPHATGELGYQNPRPRIGDRATWPEHFKNHGYYAARVSKIFHMGIPGGIEYGGDGRDHDGGNGADDERSWTERFDMHADRNQFTNLAASPEHAEVVARLQAMLARKLEEVRDNDL